MCALFKYIINKIFKSLAPLSLFLPMFNIFLQQFLSQFTQNDAAFLQIYIILLLLMRFMSLKFS